MTTRFGLLINLLLTVVSLSLIAQPNDSSSSTQRVIFSNEATKPATIAKSTKIEDSTSHWSVTTPLPQAVQEIYPVHWQSSLVVAGGLYAHPQARYIITEKVWARDITTPDATWVELASLPEPRHHPILASIGPQLFALGGFIETAQGKWTNSTDVYLLSSGAGSWQPKQPIPIALSETVIAVIDGRIHLAGGRTLAGEQNGNWNDSTDTDWHGIYNPTTDSWTTAPPLPQAKNSACSAVVNGRWHVIGGRTVELENLATHHVYDVEKDQWIEEPPMPEARGGLACAAVDSIIYVFGGEDFKPERGVFDKVLAYDTVQRTWTEFGIMPSARHGLGAVNAEQSIYLIGGATKAGAIGTSPLVSKFTLIPKSQ